MKLLFPADQLFTDETGRIFLLPQWCYHVRISCSKLLDLKNRYREVNILSDSLEPKAYLEHLKDIMKQGIPYGEEIIQQLTKFEELLVELKKGKTDVTEETSRLMTLRLLESGGEGKSVPTPLTRKQYSLEIIDLRRRYGNISRLIRFVSELYEDTKASLTFLVGLLERFHIQRETCQKSAPNLPLTVRVDINTLQEIEDLMKKASHIRSKRNEITGILEGLIESLVTGL
jgi:hypothetical protein